MPSLSIIEPHEPALYSTKRYNLLYGGRGGAKSFSTATIFICKALSKNYFRGVLMREVLSDIRQSQFQEIKDIIEDAGLTSLFHIRENTMEIVCKRNGNKIISKGFKKSSGNQTAKIKSIKDPSDIWIEEADEVSEQDFIKADTSVRTTKAEYVHIWLTFNPENEDSWINKRWFYNNEPRESEDTLIIHTTYYDNADNLKPSYIKTLEALRETNPGYAKVYIDGQWGGGVKGRIFTTWQRIEPNQIPQLPKIYGLDFGFTNDPTALVELTIHNNKVYVRELIYETHLTNSDIIQRMNSLGVDKSFRIWGDSAEPKSIEEIRRAGFNIDGAIKGPDSVRSGIDCLKQYEVYVTADSKNIWHEQKNYQWKVDRDDKPTNVPVDFMNHAIDAIRYGVSTHHNNPYYGQYGVG